MEFSNITTNLIGQPMFVLQDKIRQREAQGHKIIHLEIGDCEWGTPSIIKQAAINSLENNETHYTNSSGIDDLKQAVIKDTKKEYNFTPNLNEIVILPANSAIDFIIRCVCNPGDYINIPNPCFPTYIAVAQYLGIKTKEYIRKAKLTIINSPNNPTGKYTEPRVIEWAVNVSNLVLLDEVYSKITYENYPRPDYSKLDRDKIVFLKSFSKTYSMSGFRLGYVICKEKLAEKINLMFQTIYSCMPVFIQRAGIAALENEDFILPGIIEHLKECRDLIVGGLNSIPGVKCDNPAGAFYVFPDVSMTNLNEDILLNNGVAVLDGKYFGTNGKGHLRLCFAKQKGELEKTLNIIKSISQLERIKNRIFYMD